MAMAHAYFKSIRAGLSSFRLSQAVAILLVLSGLLLSDSAFSQTVYITRTGAKYHDDGCRYLSRSKFKTTLKEAKESQYTACSVCKPPTKVISGSGQDNVTTAPAPIRKAKSSQCTARTKSSARCSRMTTNANGKCWQHQ